MRKTTYLRKSFSLRHLILTIATVLCLAFVCLSINPNAHAYAAETNESGTAVVIKKDGTVKDYGTDIRGAWDYCDKNPKCTMKLTSDLKLDKDLSTGGMTYNTDIIFDLNGYVIDCQNKTSAFDLYKRGGLKVIDSSKAKTGKIINGSGKYGGAIRTMGRLELDGITIENCESTDNLRSGGGAIYAWVTDLWVITITQPHVYINNCTINNCRAHQGGAIHVQTDTIQPGPMQGQAFGNSGILELAALKEQENGSNGIGGATIRITNSTISNCRANTSGGALDVSGQVTLDNTKIANCSAQYGAGGIKIEGASTLKMFNSTITGCSVDDGPGGGIYIQCGIGGDMRTVPGHAEIWGGSITGNRANAGAGVSFPEGHGGSSLKIGGELIIKDNLDKNGRANNVETEGISIKLFDEGLYGKADVGIAVNKNCDECCVVDTKSIEAAEETLAYIKVDHLNNKYNQAGKEEEIGIYTKPNDKSVYMGPSHKMDIVDFQLTNRPNVKAEINRKTKEITVRFPFEEGSVGEGAWPEPIKVIWESGKGGTFRTEGSIQGEPGKSTGVGLNKYNTSIITTFHKSKTAEGQVILECNGGTQVWTVHLINEGQTRCRVRVTNGSIPGHVPYRESGKTKDYRIKIGEEIEIVADNAPAGQCFYYWGYTCRGITPYYAFNDWFNPRIKIVAPASRSAMTGLVFTAAYTDVKSVTVVNGTHTDGTTEKAFKPGEHVKVTADMSLENFDHWEVVIGKRTIKLKDAQTKSRVLEFDMGDLNKDSPSSSVYENVTVKAVAVSVEKPEAKPESGKYTGNQKIKLSCPNDKAVIFYSLNGSDYKRYDGEINLTVAEDELQREYNLCCYSALLDDKGHLIVHSDEVKYYYVIMNPSPKTSHTLKIVNGKTEDGKTEDIIKPGSNVTVVADTAAMGQYFKAWKITSGALTLTDQQCASKTINFVMPNADVTLEAVYDQSEILPYTAVVENGTLNGLEGDTQFFEGTEVTVAAATPAAGMVFDHWTAEGIQLNETQMNSAVFSFTMPGSNIRLEASYKPGEVEPHTLILENGTIITKLSGDNSDSDAEGTFFAGAKVIIRPWLGADLIFDHWDAEGIELTEEDSHQAQLIITMPDDAVKLTAVYRTAGVVPYTLSIEGGNITAPESYTAISDDSAIFYEGCNVEIAAAAVEGRTFDHWDVEGLELSDSERKSSALAITMPGNDVKLIAVYTENKNSGDDTGGGNNDYTDTGDANDVMPYALMLLMSIIGLAGCGLSRATRADGILHESRQRFERAEKSDKNDRE